MSDWWNDFWTPATDTPFASGGPLITHSVNVKTEGNRSLWGPSDVGKPVIIKPCPECGLTKGVRSVRAEKIVGLEETFTVYSFKCAPCGVEYSSRDLTRMDEINSEIREISKRVENFKLK